MCWGRNTQWAARLVIAVPSRGDRLGLMRGLELVTDRATKAPAAAETLELLRRCRNMGLLVGRGGLRGNVIRRARRGGARRRSGGWRRRRQQRAVTHHALCGTRRIKPPMCISEADIDYIIDVLDAGLAGL